jgi:hypothetical protein
MYGEVMTNSSEKPGEEQMAASRSWRLWGEWREQQGLIDVRVICNDEDPLISGTVQEFGDESIRVYIGDRPPTVTDSVAARLVGAIYQYLDEMRDGAQDAVTDEVDLKTWLDKYVGTANSAGLWVTLTFEHDRRQKYTPPSLVEEAPLTWRFAAHWQEAPGPDWRLARLALRWQHGEAEGGLEVIAKVTCQGETFITTLLSDDLLLSPENMNWMLRQLLQRHRDQILVNGGVHADVPNFGRWLGHTRGPRGQAIWGMISSSIRTFRIC